MAQTSFGRKPTGNRLERVSQSPQYKDGFVNISDTPALGENASYPKIILRSLKGNKNGKPSQPLPVVKNGFQKVDSVKPVITWFGHSSYLIQVKGKNILVDPVFSKRTSFSQIIGPGAYPGTMEYSATDLPFIDVVLITHDHYDHLDYRTILELKNKAGHFYTSLGVGAHLEYWGIEANRITEFDWWESAALPGGMQLTAAPARHFSGRGFVRNKTLWASYILHTGDYQLYLGGDSGYDSHFKQIGEKFGSFDLAILENGQYNEYWPYIHMMPEQTVQASIDLNAKILLPVHWAKFSLSVHDWNEPAIRITKKAAEMNVQLTTPRIGEQIIVDDFYPDDKWWYI